MKYKDCPEEGIRLYDIVKPKIGIFKNKECIIIAKDKNLIVTNVIENGLTISFHPNRFIFIKHLNKNQAKSYFDKINENANKLIKNYTDKNYIRNNWGIDILMINNITAKTFNDVLNKENINIKNMIDFLNDNKKYIEILCVYNDWRFCEFLIRKMLEDYAIKTNEIKENLNIFKILHIWLNK